jgi:cytosine/creatinine deaminase
MEINQNKGDKMSGKFDIMIRNARLRGKTDGIYQIGIIDGRIAAIEESIQGFPEIEIDANKNLVTESFVDPHLHLCKVYTFLMLNHEEVLRNYYSGQMGKAMNAVEGASRVKEKYEESWIIKNVRRSIAQAVIHGCTHIRAFADVDTKARLEGVKSLLHARDEFKDIVDIQVVAFAQDGIVREPGASDLIRQSMSLGADVVGGIPWIEYTETDIAQHVKEVFDIAEEYGKDVSMLVDDAGDPGLRSLELMAVEAIHRGWQGRVLAHHARAMALYPKPYFQKVAALLKKAGLGIVSDPHTGPLHARVKELLEEEVLVCLGQDDVSDAYYPYGRNNLLEVAFLASHLLWMTSLSEMEILYDMITVRPAQAIGLKGVGLKVGAYANLVVLDVPNVLEALRFHAAPTEIISHGKVVDKAKMHQIIQTSE